MTGPRGVVVVVCALLCASRSWAAEQPAACITCHGDHVSSGLATGGHAPDVECVSCHDERRSGRVGAGHRSRPACRECHDDVTGHPPKQGGRTLITGTMNCIRCHDTHGSTNALLVNTGIRTRGRRASVYFTDAGGAVPGGFVDPTHPGQGLCEVCHRTTKFYRANGTGQPHFTQTCTDCHDHAVGFGLVITNTSCPVCHPTQAANFATPNGHSTRFVCTDCHTLVAPVPGPGHATAEACPTCHAGVATHAPPGSAPFSCTRCHNPHGTDNTRLVLDAIVTPQGPIRPIVFDNIAGKADGSFASASAPGTGICEICHTTTRFYRADGTGEPHYTFSCLPCHRHSAGFNPP